MIEELDALARDIVTRGELNATGRERAEFVARALNPKTARALALLYAEAAKLAGPEPKPSKRRAKRATR